MLWGMMARYTSADVVVVGLIGERSREEFVERILGAGGLAKAVVVAAADIDRRKMTTVGQLARQYQMPVEDRSRRVGDRVVGIVALDQHRVQGGDAARALDTVAGALTQR